MAEPRDDMSATQSTLKRLMRGIISDNHTSLVRQKEREVYFARQQELQLSEDPHTSVGL